MEILPTQISAVENLAQKYGLDLVILFGSCSTGRVHAESDTDIAVRARRVLNLDEQMEIAREFEHFFKEVDLCDIRRASPLLLAAIAHDAKLLFQSQPLIFEEFKIFAANQYIDYRPVLDRIAKRNRELIKKL